MNREEFLKSLTDEQTEAMVRLIHEEVTFYCECGAQGWSLWTFQNLNAWNPAKRTEGCEMQECLKCNTGPTMTALMRQRGVDQAAE